MVGRSLPVEFNCYIVWGDFRVLIELLGIIWGFGCLRPLLHPQLSNFLGWFVELVLPLVDSKYLVWGVFGFVISIAKLIRALAVIMSCIISALTNIRTTIAYCL